MPMHAYYPCSNFMLRTHARYNSVYFDILLCFILTQVKMDITEVKNK